MVLEVEKEETFVNSICGLGIFSKHQVQRYNAELT